mgnify:CR=1 FL=1
MEKNFETEVLTRLAVIESKLDNYRELKTVAYNADTRSKENRAEIEEMKENSKWIKRTIIGEVIGLAFLAIALFIGLK